MAELVADIATAVLIGLTAIAAAASLAAERRKRQPVLVPIRVRAKRDRR